MGDAHCMGCEDIEGRSYPKPHANRETTCQGLIHTEIFRDAANEATQTIYHCDVCYANPE